MLPRLLSLALLSAASGSVALAQTRPVAAPPTAQLASPAAGVEDIVNRFQHALLSAAQAMPAEKYNFTPASLNLPGASFGTVRTFADELKHVAQANFVIAANITGGNPAVDPKVVGALHEKDDIIAALSSSFIAVHAAMATITTANQNDAVDDPGVGPHQSKLSEAAWVAAHGYDHYGQIVEYLRMNGIVPLP